MDIIDIMLARSLSSQGQIETYASMAQKAVTRANTAVSNIETITAQTSANNEAAEEALANATSAYEALTSALDELGDFTSTLETEIDNLTFSYIGADNTKSYYTALNIGYPSGKTTTLNNIVKYYYSTGTNTDGTMTQAAITSALTSAMAGNSTYLGTEYAGYMTKVGSDGYIAASSVSEATLLNLINQSSSSAADESSIASLYVDYNNNVFSRLNDSASLNAGSDFDSWTMYGGRMRCNVADDGTINAFYGDSNYAEDGSNGQVMVYQPKFYYKREIGSSYSGTVGQIINNETFSITSSEDDDFKLHPLFKDENGNELEYVLLSAYEGGCYDESETGYLIDGEATVDFLNDKLCSISGIKPISGANNSLNVDNAELLATNRGDGWHIQNMAAVSAEQMLFMIEYGALNAQTALARGICDYSTSSSKNIAALTGSTASLGNASGSATTTYQYLDGTTTGYTEAGKIAISYRGVENDWGNIWKYIGGVNIYGTGSQQGGVPYICNDFNYDSGAIGDNYQSIGFCLPTYDTWVSALGYGNTSYDWVLMPAETTNGNSALPIGDLVWTTANLNGVHTAVFGGPAAHNDKDGMFYFGTDYDNTNYSYSKGARLMYIPKATDSNYASNYAKWVAKMEG